LIAALVAAALVAGPPPTAAHPIVVGEERMSRGFLRHWADFAQRSQDGMPRAQARALAADVLIRYRWIAGEAAERGVVVTREEVDREYRARRAETFRRPGEYRAFLRESGQTPGDVRWRVRIELHSDRLRELATAGAATPEEQQERLAAFVRAFQAKWRARTVCRAPWTSAECGATSPARTRRSPPRGRRANRWDGAGGWSRVPSTTAFRLSAPAS
jgi:hypothetical protein